VALVAAILKEAPGVNVARPSVEKASPCYFQHVEETCCQRRQCCRTATKNVAEKEASFE